MKKKLLKLEKLALKYNKLTADRNKLMVEMAKTRGDIVKLLSRDEFSSLTNIINNLTIYQGEHQ